MKDFSWEIPISTDDYQKLGVPIKDRQRLTEAQYRLTQPDIKWEDKVFGEEVLYQHSRIEELISMDVPRLIIDPAKKLLHKKVLESKDNLRDWIKRGETQFIPRVGVLAFFNDTYTDEGLRNRFIKAMIDVNETKIDSAEGIMRHFFEHPDLIDDDVFIKMLTRHKKLYSERMDESRVKAILQFILFQERLKILDDDLGLQSALVDKAKNLKGNFTIVFDETGLFEPLRELGRTDSHDQIRVDPWRNWKHVVEPVLIHEWIHNLSGKSYRIRTQPIDMSLLFDDEELPLDFEKEVEAYGVREKGGLKIYDYFAWLDEGITNKLTHMLVKRPEEHRNLSAYEVNEELINKILQKGNQNIPEELLFKAYFEDYDPEKKPGKKLPNTRDFFRAVSRSFAPGFLVRLDSLIRKVGDGDDQQEVITKINQSFDQIVSILINGKTLQEAVSSAADYISTLKIEQ